MRGSSHLHQKDPRESASHGRGGGTSATGGAGRCGRGGGGSSNTSRGGGASPAGDLAASATSEARRALPYPSVGRPTWRLNSGKTLGQTRLGSETARACRCDGACCWLENVRLLSGEREERSCGHACVSAISSSLGPKKSSRTTLAWHTRYAVRRGGVSRVLPRVRWYTRHITDLRVEWRFNGHKADQEQVGNM